MAARLSPLALALIAAGLIVVVVGVDLAFDRAYTLEVQDEDGDWITVATSGQRPYEAPRSSGFVEVNRTDELSFRLATENDYPWALDEGFQVWINGQPVEEGRITAAASSTGEAIFTFPVEDLVQDAGMPKRPALSIKEVAR